MGDPVMGWMPCVLLLLLRHTCLGLEVTTPSAQVASFHSPALLPCTFSIGAPSINPQFLAIIWYHGDQELLRFDNKEKVVKKGLSFDEQEARKGTASLTIHNVTIADQGTYKCLIIYSPNRQQREIRLDVHATPEVRIQRKALRKDEENSLYCSISDFFPRELRVTWLRNNVPIPEGSEMGAYQINADGTYRVNSSVVLTPAQIQDRPSITCQVEHVSLQGLIQDAFMVQYGVTPKVRLIPTRTSDKSELMYACEAKGFYPEPLSIHWLVNGKKEEDLSRGSADGVFNKNVYYQINLKEDNLPERISCSVQHETLANPLIETLEVNQFNECTRHCHSGLTAVVIGLLVASLLFIAISGFLIMKKKYTRHFQVSPIHQDQIWPNDNMVTLYCMALNCPKVAEATWTVTVQDREPIIVSDCQKYKDEENGPLLHRDYTVRTDKVERNGLSNFTTKLSFNPEASEYKKMEVKCKFLCGRKSKERSLECTFKIKKPEFKDCIKVFLDDNKDVVCSATLEKFYPQEIWIQWSYGADQYTNIESTEEITHNTEDDTYKAVSKCKIPGESLPKSSKVRVMWKHQSMGQPDSHEMSLAEIPQRPVMEDIVVPSLLHCTEAKLQCDIQGYFPKDLKVTWLLREAGKPDLYEVSSSDKYKIPLIEEIQQPDKTYSCTASLILSVSAKTDHGSEFICRVTHPSLDTHLEKRTGELSVEGIPVVRKILQKGRCIVLEIGSFSTQDIKVTWEKADNQSGPYTGIDETYIHNTQTGSDDRSLSLTSTYEPARKIDLKKEKDKYFKVIIEHGALKTPEVIIFFRSKGDMYRVSGNEKKPLEKVKQGSKISKLFHFGNTEDPEKTTDPNGSKDKQEDPANEQAP